MSAMKKKYKRIIIAAIITVIISGLGTSIAVGYYRDKQKFINVSDDIVLIMNKLGSTSEVKTNRYCIYNNMKYSKGELMCFVTASLQLHTNVNQKNVETDIRQVLNLRNWVYEGSNSLTVNSKDNTYSITDLYATNNLNCSVKGRDNDEKRFTIDIDCSGPAKAEWFPVREN